MFINKQKLVEFELRHNELLRKLDNCIHKINYQNQQLRAEVESLKQENEELHEEINNLRDYLANFT